MNFSCPIVLVLASVITTLIYDLKIEKFTKLDEMPVCNKIKAYVFKQEVNFFTPPQNRGGVIFSLQFVCLCVCPALFVNKIPAEPIWTRFLLNGFSSLNKVFKKSYRYMIV